MPAEPQRVPTVRASAHVWAIPLPFALPVPGRAPVQRLVHAYLVRGTEQTVVVDCGTAAAAEVLPHALAEQDLAPTDIAWLLATHEHADHMGAAAPLVAAHGWPVLAHEAAVRWLEDAAVQAAERPIGGFAQLMAGSVRVTRALREEDRLELGGCSLEVLHTPGHSRGSLSVIVRPDQVVLTGDVLVSTVAAPFYDDPAAVRASVAKLRQCTEQGMTLLASHAPTPSLVGAQALDETFALVQRLGAGVQAAVHALGHHAEEDVLVRRALDLGGWPEQPVMPVTRLTVRAHLAEC